MRGVVTGSAAGTPNACGSNVRIAIPIWQKRISPVLDTAARLLVVNRRRSKEQDRREVILTPLGIDALARSVAELHVDVLLCAAVSDPLRRALERRGIRVRPHLCGEVDEVLMAFCSKQLQRPEFRMPGCWGNHSNGACCRRRTARGKTSARNDANDST